MRRQGWHQMCWRGTQSTLSLAKCVNKVPSGGLTWLVGRVRGLTLLMWGSALPRLMGQGGAEWQIRFGGIWCWFGRGNQEIPKRGGATDLREQHKQPPPHRPSHIRQEIGNIFLAGTINDQRSGLRSAINGFWREPLNIRGNFSPCCESSPLSRFSKPIPILRMSTPHAWSFSATIAMK